MGPQKGRAVDSKAAALFVVLVLLPHFADAQASDTRACNGSHAGLEANKQLLHDFFAFSGTDQERAERFLTPDYVQHNPRLLRMNALTGATGREAWLKGFHEALRRGIDIVDLGGIRLDRPVLVMAECDLVTALYKGVLHDPDRPAATYEAFAFETFRVRDNKFSEHWDQVTLKPGWMTPSDARTGAGASTER